MQIAARGSFMSKIYDVAGIGNAIVDVFAPVDDSFLLEHNIAKGVMTLIDEFRAEQLFSAFADVREIAGGSAANTMVGIASFGGKGLFVGKVKDDRLGQSFAASLKDTGNSNPPTSMKTQWVKRKSSTSKAINGTHQNRKRRSPKR
jgi:sugar/nucleoside kinase (ribokinase family)